MSQEKNPERYLNIVLCDKKEWVPLAPTPSAVLIALLSATRLGAQHLWRLRDQLLGIHTQAPLP